MQDASGEPEEGETRFAANGTLEVFDGKAWKAYQPPVDDGLGFAFKGSPEPEPSADDPADGSQ
jgi:hypothetical protein